MTDLDFRSRRWAKVPRVTASLSSTFGFLLATMALRVGLSDLVGALDDSTVLSVNSAVLDAVDVAAIGLVGAAFCVAVHARARAALTERLRDADRLVDLLERLGEGAIEPFPDPSRRASVSPPDAPGASQPRAD
jgi:alkylhydroperoxidase family enzyme